LIIKEVSTFKGIPYADYFSVNTEWLITSKSQLLNNKNVDKSTSLDLWYYFMLDKPYPNWFWSKSPKFEKTDLPDSDFKLLFLKLGLNKEQDLIYLLDNYPDLMQEELKFYKTKIK
jgi:hypothetical protein